MNAALGDDSIQSIMRTDNLRDRIIKETRANADDTLIFGDSLDMNDDLQKI